MKKVYATYLLFLFIAFLVTPTIVKAIDRNIDISIVYNFAEEEQSETSVASFIDFVVNSQDYEALSDQETHDALTFDVYQFVIKSHYTSIPSPPPDSLV